MCGVSGFLTRANLPGDTAEARLWAMIATLRHRGPDDEGVWTDGRAGLAHARLSIIDLSPAAHQPMASADGTVWITYNGEVYNFAEIRQELDALGYSFRSRSDTEVIVNGWHAWGPNVLSRLRGMFALAIWDRRSQRLILARDRLGKKPLYYAATATTFLFGSEIKALLAWPGVPRATDLSAIDRYLTLGYVPAPETAFAGIRKLPAAHCLVVEADAVAVLPRLIWHYGEPFADPSAVPTYYVSELARRKVTVALNGDGGDECFLGYRRYKAMRYVSWLDGMPSWSRAELARLLGLAPLSAQQRFKIPRIRGALGASKQQPGRRYAFTLASFTDEDKQDCYSGAMQDQLEQSALDLLEPYFAEADSLVAGANWADIHTYLPDDLMVKVDVASMAHGLEARSPLLDHVLMEWAAGLPDRVKMARGVTKTLFKSAMERYLPAELLYRPKMGFSCPVDHWFRNELKEFAHDTLLSQSARQRGLFRPDYVQRLLAEHCSLTRDHHRRLWALLMLELWFRMWIDAPAEAEILRPAA